MYYQSRYHLTNGSISLAIDSLTGALLELTCPRTGENLIKNHCYSLAQPFAIYCYGNEKTCLRPGDAGAIAKYPELRPEISVAEDGRSASVSYPALWDGSNPRKVRVTYTVTLPEGEAESRWDITLKNESPDNLDTVRFPCLNGVYLGGSWKDDTLLFPHICGMKISDPVTRLGIPGAKIHWRWQNYRYTYPLENLSVDFADGTRGLVDEYSGLLSMKWLDYYGDDLGLYFACHDPSFRACSLRADTFGENSPGMNFSFGHPVDLNEGDRWEAPTAVIALHEGDWHRGAEKYRAFHRMISPAATSAPDWFKRSAGLVAHYDFKYQGGGVVHRFKDIRRLLDEAREMGLNHLLLSGWHRDGFDNGFPEYVPDEDLGTVEELKSQIKQVTDDGGHVCFYVNSRLANTKYEHLREFIAENTVQRRDGSLHVEQYGADGMCFAVQCVGSAGWRKKLEDTVAYLTGEIGIDGMYLDQLAMGYPGRCYNKNHDHSFGEWNIWYQKALQEMHRRRQESGKPPISIIHEGVSDSYGPYVSGQLVSTFFYHLSGAFPEMYRYTFPEQILTDMIYPGENLAMRPVHVAQASRALMDRAFRTGLYYWVYDLVDDNTFTRAPKSLAYLKAMVQLRRFWLERFGQGAFVDRDHVRETEEGLEVSCYELEGGLLLACCNTAEKPLRLTMEAAPKAARWFTAASLPEGEPARKEGEALIAPEAPLSLLYLEY